MKYAKTALLAIAVILFSSFQDHQQKEFEKIIPGQLIVMLELGKQPDHLIRDLQLSTSLEVEQQLSSRLNIWLFNFDFKNISHDEMLHLVKRHPDVEQAQFNHKVTLRSTVPDDPRYNQQWGMFNSGQSGGTPGAHINAPMAWDFTTGGLTAHGDTIVVAVIDGRFDLNHEDINFFRNYGEIAGNGIDDDGNGFIDDVMGWNAQNFDYNVHSSSFSGQHGTHVSGIIGAKGNNTKGVAGVNWGVKILPITGSSGNESTVVIAYDYALEMRSLYDATNGAKGAFVVATNSSFGVDFGQPADFPIWCAMYDSLGARGILSAGATINSNQDIDAVGDIPTACSSSWLITVTNTTHNDEKNNGAGFGQNTIQIGAPGTNIQSTVQNNDYKSLTGTSMATPHVAGAIALMYAAACNTFMDEYKADPAAKALQIKQLLLTGTDPLSDLSGRTVSGGRLNIYNSLNLLVNGYCSTCIDLDVQASPPNCNGSKDGVAQVSVSSGVPPYNYSWSNGSLLQQTTGLAAGVYSVTVTDSTGCIKVELFNLEQPPSLSLGTIVIHETEPANGAATVMVTGGVPPFTYIWSDPANQSAASAMNLTAGTYSVTVYDGKGCSSVAEVLVQSYVSARERLDEKSVSLYPNPATGIVTLELGNIKSSSTDLEIFNMLGERIMHRRLENLSSGSAHQIDVSGFPAGVFLVRLKSENEQYVLRLVKE